METFASHLRALQIASARLRIELLHVLHNAQSGHLGGSLSVMEMLVALYFGHLPGSPIMRYDPRKPGSEEQDYFVLSKGHAAAAWYTVLAHAGFFDKEELLHYRQSQSMLQAYPVKKVPGVVVTTGAPGYGFAAAVGLALSLKMEKQHNRVFCLIGDGELQAGQLWEAALVAAHYKLDNLTVLLDWNGLQMDGTVRSVVNVEPITDKFEGFGWKTIPVTDGHNFEDILLGVERAFETQRRPSVLVCRTIKGKGVVFAENKPFYHAEVLSDEEMAEAIPRLEAELEMLENEPVQ